MSSLKFYIRHHSKFLQDKLILVFKSEQAKEYLEQSIEGSHFEEVTSEVAEEAARIGINGKVITYGYTYKLTDDEMNQLSTSNWERTAELLAEGNERLYNSVKESRK